MNAVSFSSACTTKRFPSSRCASAIQIVRPLESIAETQAQLQPALLRLSAILLHTSTLRRRLAAINGNATATGKLRTNVATPRRPESSPGTARPSLPAAFQVRRSFYWQESLVQGLIHIVAEPGAPTEYPAPACIVTTTLYA